jgi:glycosyltransferase involved in cell wall biosynthesis
VPWTVTFSESELQRPAGDSGRVFAGGNSLRDYDPLIEAAGSLPAPVDIATSTLSAEQHRRLPANVVARVWPQREYDELLLNAAVVVVPLQSREDRSSGQTTYVNAMARGKALVITDSPGVRDYIEHGRTGLIVPPGDPDALAASIRRLLDDPAERRQMGQRAREYALSQLTLSHYARRLLAVADEAVRG